MAYIDIIQPEDADGHLKELYEELLEKRGKIAEVMKIVSLNPEAMEQHMELYMTVMFGKSPLKRPQRELIAVIVSGANNCEYCIVHHGTALNHFWKDDSKIQLLNDDYRQLDLSEQDRLLCDYASELTTNPNWIDRDKHIEKMRNAGLDDRAITDATLVIGYFNFINRIVLGLGADLEEDRGEGYNYD